MRAQLFQKIAMLLICLPFHSTQAQVDPMTVGMVREALGSVLNQFNETLKTAGQEVRASGNSLQSNAQNTLADMDRILSTKLKYTFDKLDKQERQMVDDALLLTRQVRTATDALLTKSSAEARRTIADADITAYNTSYSLPCRSQIPRVLYTWPESVRLGVDDPEFRIRGNFLDIGSEPKIAIDEKPAKIIARTRNEIVVRIPDNVISQLKASQSVRVEIPAKQIERTGYLAGLWCREKETAVSPALSAALSVRPATSYVIEGKITGDYAADDPHDFPYKGYKQDENCEASYDWPQVYCMPSEYSLSAPHYFDIAVHSANCNSAVGTPQPSGDRCVSVPAHIGGCGVDKLPLIGKVNCRGRGWVDYTLVIHGSKGIRTPLPNSVFQGGSPNGSQTSYRFEHASSTQTLPDVQWKYDVKVTVTNGGAPHIYQLGNGNPHDGPVRTRIESGILYLTIQDL